MSSVRSTNGYVRTTNLPAHASHAAVFWTTVVSATVWVEFHLDKSKPSTKALPKFPPGRDPAFQQKFDSLVSQPDWFAPPTDNGGAWLGRPAQDGANCWVSCTEINADFQLPSDSLNGSARRVVEALGLMPTTPFDSYVRYEVDAAQLRSTATRDACRPSFADLGNAWFRVSTCTPRAKHYASHGWGSTVDLSAVRARESDDTGHPERVAASIPINAETVKKPEWLASQPGDHQFSSHPTAQFDSTLFSGRSPSDIETAVLELWHNIPSVP